MTQDITSLIEKLEGAEVGSLELDALVHVAVANDPNTYVVEPDAKSIFSHRPGWYRTGNDLSCLADPVTTSLDAALALAERVLPNATHWEVCTPYGSEFTGPYAATISDPRWLDVSKEDWDSHTHGEASGNTPALALCAAILRAQSEARR